MPDEIPDARKPTTVSLKPVYPADRPLAVECVTFARFSHLGGQVMLDLGLVDDQALIAMRDQFKNETPSDGEHLVRAFVTRRFGLSIETMMMLKGNLDEILAKMRASGLIEDAKNGKADGE